MKRTTSPRRGNCVMGLVVGVAVIGLLLLIGGAITFMANSPGAAFSKLTSDLKALTDGATAIEAPGTVQVELKSGGAAFMLLPSGQVGDKVIPTPPASVTYTISVTGPTGEPVKIEANTQPRNGTEPFYLFGFCQLKTDGKYEIEVKASDDSTPAAILAVRANEEELTQLAQQGVQLTIGGLGGCGAVCGLALFVVFGVIALMMRKKAQPDPLAL